ncbi:MAG: hypothetical protein FJX67_19145, partial [Alphaproteobacteria bacterium]|nr:hypothetical protein [Alphaproteobacteria bacterium]
MAWLVLSWPWLSGTVTIPWDAKAHWQPFVQFIARAFADGDGPLWTPNVFSGWPTVADPQSGVFTPILLALAFLDPAPSFRAIDGAVLAMLGLGGLAVIGYCHDRGWAGPAAVIGALAFAFGASAAWRVQHLGQILSLAWFPMALFFLERALMRRSVAWGSLAGIAAGLMLIGRDQVSLIAGYALLARVVWHWLARPGRWQRFGASVIPTGAAGLLAVLLAAVPVALSALLALETNRPTIDLEGAGRGSLHPALLLTALIPDVFAASGPMAAYWGPPSFAWSGTGLFLAQNMGVLYAGAVPILLVVWGTVRGWAWTGGLGATAALLAVTLAYALGWYTPVFRWLYEWLPFVDHYRRPADATFVAGALMALLAAGLLHRFLAAPAPVRAAVAVAGLAVAALVAIA